MAEEKQQRWLPLFNQWKNYTMEMFAKRAHVFMANSDGSEKSFDDVVKKLFDDNKQLIFKYMTDDDKIEFGWWKANGSWPSKSDKESDDYEEKAKDKYPKSEDDLDIDMHLPYPCIFRIDSHCITSELMISQTNFQEQEDDFYAFADERLSEIIEDEILSKRGVQRRVPGVTVFCWSKSQNSQSGDSNSDKWKGAQLSGGGREEGLTRLDTSWIDLSQFIISVNTNVGADSGSFSISLPFTDSKRYGSVSVGAVSLENGESISPGQYSGINYQGQRSCERVEFNAKDTHDLFNHILSVNDVIFISFADLHGNERENQKIQDFQDAENISTLASDSSFEMIGLIDSISVVKNSQSSEAHIEISGRDLNKLLVDDGAFFFNPSITKAPSEVFFNEQGYEKQGDIREVDEKDGKYQAINRMRRTAGELDIFCNQTNLNIDYVIKGVISQLANIEIVPSDAFVKWENRTRWKEIHPDEELKEQQQGNATGSNSNQ